MKKKLFSALLLFVLSYIRSQQFGASTQIHGIISRAEGPPLAGALVVNTSKNVQVASGADGGYSISASVGDDIRFAKAGFEREKVIVSAGDFGKNLGIILQRAVINIEEVKINAKNPAEKNDELRVAIGLPKGPEKPREVPPPTVKQAGIFKYLRSNTKLENLYKNLSGDARRMRATYEYEDSQDRIAWLRKNIRPTFFTENNIPEEKIPEFFIFAFAKSPSLINAVKSGNVTQAEFILDVIVPQFIAQMKQK